MQQRKGTAAQWAAADPILNAGEIGWESDTNKFKIGDGTNHWDDLTYFLDATDMGGSFSDYVPLTQKNQANGVAQLNADINVMTKTAIEFEGANADAYETTLGVVEPTADRAITLPDATGTVALTSDITVSASSTNTFTNKSISLATNTVTGTKAEFNSAMSDADFATIAGSETLTNKTLTSPVITGAVFNDGSIVFEGATANDHETTFTITDPTADRTITFPDATGTVALAANVAALAGATFTGAVSGTDLTLSGNLTVNGTTTNINSTSLVVEDKNIILADVETPTDTTADGGGITLKGATDKTFNWVDATDAWTSSEHVNIVSGKSYKINNTAISTALPALTWGEVKNGKSGLVIS